MLSEVKVEREKIEIEVDKDLMAWIRECVAKGTFAKPDDAFELAVAYVRDTAIREGISQETTSWIKSNVPLCWNKAKPLFPTPEFGCDKKKVKADGTTNWKEYIGHRVLLRRGTDVIFEAVIEEICKCGDHIKCYNPNDGPHYWRTVKDMGEFVEDLGMYHFQIYLSSSTFNYPINYTYPLPWNFNWGPQDSVDGVQHPKNPWG